MKPTIYISKIFQANKLLPADREQLFIGKVITQFSCVRIFGNSPAEVVSNAWKEYPDLEVKE